MRKFIYCMVRKSEGEQRARVYDYFICAISFISIIPLMFKTSYPVFERIDNMTAAILFADYILRWTVSDYLLKKGIKSFIMYPFTVFGIMDILSLLPTIGLLEGKFRILRAMRIFKIFRYSKNFDLIINTLNKERRIIYPVILLAGGYIFISALIIFSCEPDTFNDFFSALYWASTALTTVGYGDIYPHTYTGRLISMLSSFFGIAVIALPAGIITAGYMEEINNEKNKK